MAEPTQNAASDFPVTLRPLRYPDDLERTVAIYNTWSLEPTTIERALEWEAGAAAETRRYRYVAESRAGEVVGYVEATHAPWSEPGRYEVELCVDVRWRRRGVGAALWRAALAWLRAEGATRAEVELRDNDPDSARFAEAQRFTRERHRFESTLNLASFDERPFIGALALTQAEGYRFFSLADVGDTEEARHGDYEINRRASLDIPGAAQTFAPFEEWRRFVCGASWYRPDGQIIAARGDEWIGLAAVGYYAATNSMYNMVTGVDRAHRGHGVAQALKLLAIRCARRYGAVYIRTHNDSENAPILAINRKLGYQPQPGLYQYALTLK
jgi:GNAT superfamily N-acetyltransferase